MKSSHLFEEKARILRGGCRVGWMMCGFLEGFQTQISKKTSILYLGNSVTSAQDEGEENDRRDASCAWHDWDARR
jgi:hypothetical protein